MLSFSPVQEMISQNTKGNMASIDVKEGSKLIVKNNISILSDIIITNSGDIIVGGNCINNAPNDVYVKGPDGIVTFNGDHSQEISGKSRTLFSNLQILQNVNLGAEVLISTSLNLVDAKLNLNDHNLYIQSEGELVGCDSGAFVIAQDQGKLIREVSGLEVEFPVGTNKSFLPLILSNAGTLDNFGVGVFEDVLDRGLAGNTIQEIENCVNNTWDVSEEAMGGSDLTIFVQWDSANEGADLDRTKSGIGHFTGGSWSGLIV